MQKKTILFVDDQQTVLNAYQQAVREAIEHTDLSLEDRSQHTVLYSRSPGFFRPPCSRILPAIATIPR